MSFGTLYLGAAVADFMARYFELKVELILNDRFIDPLEEGVDVTVRIGELADSSLIARRLARARRVLVASPGYLARNPPPAQPEHLADHCCLVYGNMAAAHRWQLVRGAETITVQIQSSLSSNNGEVLRAAALTGGGIANLPTFIVGPDIAANRLQLVLPDTPPTELCIFALYAPNRYLAAKTRVFIDFLVDRFGDAPEWDAFDRTISPTTKDVS